MKQKRKENVKYDFVTILKFFSVKDTLMKKKDKPQTEKNVFEKPIHDKELGYIVLYKKDKDLSRGHQLEKA